MSNLNLENSYNPKFSKYHFEILKILVNGSKDFSQIIKETKIHKKIVYKKILELISVGAVLREDNENKREFFFITEIGQQLLIDYEKKFLKFRNPEGRFPRVKKI